MSVRTSVKGVGVLLGGVAGAAAMGPLGVYFGASLGTAVAGVLSAEAVAAISGGIAAIGVELIGRALGDFKNSRNEQERLKLNHDVARAVTQALANAMSDKTDDLTQFWAKGLEYAAKNAEAHKNLYKTAHEQNWETQTLSNLNDPEKLDDLVWKDVCNFLLRLPEWPGDCYPPFTDFGFKRQAGILSKISEKDLQSQLDALRDTILPKMVRAYADAIAADDIAWKKSMFYLAIANAGNSNLDQEAVVKAVADQLTSQDFLSLMTGSVTQAVSTMFTDLQNLIVAQHDQTRAVIIATIHEQVKGGYALIPPNLPKEPAQGEIKRTELMEEIGTKLGDGPAVLMGGKATLQGHGGQGKTTLAFAYGRANFDKYPGGVYVVRCAGAKIVEPFVALRLQNERVGEPPPEHPEQIVRDLLSDSAKKALVIFDNVDSKAQWDEFKSLLPTCDILVTTRDEQIDPERAVKVEPITLDQAKELLGKYRPSALQPQNAQAIQSIHRDTEGLAALIAAIGMVMDIDQKDDWAEYAGWLAKVDISAYPKLDHYPHTTVAILDDLRSKLSEAQRRVMEYASLLPEDNLRFWWLEWLLQNDGIDLGMDSRGEPREPLWHLEGLKKLGLLTPMDEGGQIWSIHRLHLKRARESLSATMDLVNPMVSELIELADVAFKEAWGAQKALRYSQAIDLYSQTIQIREALRKALGEQWPAEFQNDLAAAYANRGVARQGLQDFDAAIKDYDEAIKIMEALRKALGEQWPFQFQNDLAGAYMNRGNARQNKQDFGAAVADYGEAIKIMEALRKALGEQWPAEFQNDLAKAYGNRGNAQQNKQDFGAAIADYGEAIKLMEALRKALGEQWPFQFQNDLAAAYANRGVARQGLQDFDAAIKDYDEAIKIMEALRKALGEQWPFQFQNDLATAYMNRGNAQRGKQHYGAAIEDYGAAIELREALRDQFEQSGEQWPAEFQNDLAKAYGNRGNARQGLQDFDAAIKDYDEAIKLREALRDQFEQSGEQWPAEFQNDLAGAYMNRGSARQGLQDFDAAIADYGEAIKIMEALRKALGEQWPFQFQNNLAGTYMNRGLAMAKTQSREQLSDDERRTQSLSDFGKALDLAQDLRDRLEPLNRWSPGLRHLYALILRNRAVLYQQLGMNDLANIDLQAAAAVWPTNTP